MAVAGNQHEADWEFGFERQRNGAQVEKIDDTGVSQRHNITSGEDIRVRNFGNRRGDDRRRRHDQHIEAGKPRIHRAYQIRAPVQHVDIIRRRNYATALDPHAYVRIEVGRAAAQPVKVNGTSFRR